MARSNIKRRLERLEQERKGEQCDAGPVVAIYDPTTGKTLQVIPDGASAVAWLPDNGRGDRV